MNRIGCRNLVCLSRGAFRRNLAVFSKNVPGFSRIKSAEKYATRLYASSVNMEPFLNGSSQNYVEEMYESWRSDPKSVHRVGSPHLGRL